MIGVVAIDHVQITVAPEDCDQAVRFYERIVGLPRVAKPNDRPGAWFRHERGELHVGVERVSREGNESSKRHVCFRVADVDAAERAMRDAGVAVIADDSPAPGWKRFYVRDPGGNRVEIAQPVP